MKAISQKGNSLILGLIATALIGQGSGYGKIYFFHAVLGLCFAAYLVKRKFDPAPFKTLGFPIGLGIFSLISILWSPNMRAGIVENIHFWMGVLVLFLVLNSGINKDQIYKVIRSVVWINIFLCLGESLKLFRYPYSLFSEFADIFGKGHSDWTPQASDVPTGFHWNPNNNAFFCLIFSPIILSRAQKLESLLYIVFTSWVIYMSGSKLIIIVWAFFIVLYSFFSLRKKIIVFLLVVLGLISFSFVTVSSKKSQRIEKYSRTIPSLTKFLKVIPEIFISRFKNEDVVFDYSAKDLSLHERLIFLDGLAILIKDNLFFGVGAGGLSGKFHEQGGRKMSLATPHFYLLELLTKYGIIYVSIYMIWILKLFKRSFFISNLSSISLLLFLVFNPVISTSSYFLPMWILLLFHTVSIEKSYAVR